MPSIRPALAATLAIGALAVWLHPGSDPHAAESASSELTVPASDDLPPRLAPPTTTTAPPTTTTTAPPPPPPPPPAMAAPATPRPAAAMRAAVAAPAPPPPPPPPPPPVIRDDPASETRALQLVNDERARAGLPPLGLNPSVATVARSWSRFMAAHGVGHNPNLARDVNQAGVTGWRSLGENVGNGYSVEQIHTLFMGSGSHRANILSSAFSEVGIGFVESGGRLWVTMDFVGW